MQIFLNGFISGLSLAVLASAFSIVYLPCRVFHLALGGIYAITPFIVWQLLEWKVPCPLACLAAIACGAILSALCEKLNHGPLEKKDASPAAHMISSLGIYIIVSQIAVIAWGNEPKVLRTGVDTVVKIGETTLTHSQLWALGTALIILCLFHLWLWKSNAGLKFRALSDNAKELALKGMNIARLRLSGFAISGALAAASSLMVAYDVGFDANGGLSTILLAVVAVIVGGKTSFVGPILGALLLGILRANVIWLLSTRWQEAVTFALLATFLLVRPQGIFGSRTRVEAQS